MKGTLLRILETLPAAMRLQSGSATVRVGDLIAALDTSGARDGEQPFVLFCYQDGRRALVRVNEDGSLSKTASFVEVSG